MIEFHPLANIFPLIEGAEFETFAADIARYGLREPIVLHEGKILEGRNRYRACLAVGVEPHFIQFEGDDPLAFVISKNLHRRHLSESQRAMVAARMAQLELGANQHREGGPNGLPSKTITEAAALLNVSERTVKRGRAVLKSGSGQLIRAVDDDKIDLGAAAKIVKLDKARQDQVVERVLDGEKPTEAHRVVKSKDIVDRQLAGPEGKYRIIYADPPWDYGQHKMPDYCTEARDHYPAMTLEDICGIPVDQWAEDDAVLFLWVTVPFTLKAGQVIRDWGFEFKTEFIWDKIKHNMGHYSSVRHEKLYVCTRGACQPDVRKLFDSVQSIKRTGHSVKPVEFYDIIETLYPCGRRLELFHRGEDKRPGWECWGFESGVIKGNEVPPPIADQFATAEPEVNVGLPDLPEFLPRAAE